MYLECYAWKIMFHIKNVQVSAEAVVGLFQNWSFSSALLIFSLDIVWYIVVIPGGKYN